MTSTLFHFVVGTALVLSSIWFLRHRRMALGWTLAVLGTTIAVMGVMAPAVHRYLHH